MTPAKLIGLLLVILYIVALRIVELLDVPIVFEPDLLLFLLNTIFHGIIPIAVAYVAGKSYLKGGSVTVLFMGCGMLAFGLFAIPAGWLINQPAGPNLTVTIHNTGIFLGSIFCIMGAILGPLSSGVHNAERRRSTLFIAYSGIAIFMLCFCFAAIQGLIPPFFIQGAGPTPVRQAILGSSILLCFISSIFFIGKYLNLKSDFLYWYALSLGLICVGLFGIFVQKAVGSPMGWVARTAFYIGGIFALFAVLSALKDARSRNVPVTQFITDSFRMTESGHRIGFLAALPIPILLVLLVILGSLGTQTVFEPPGLFAALNILFLTISSLAVVFFATRGYLRSGVYTMLMLGSGALTIGLGSSLSGWLLSLQSGGPNAGATILNMSFFLSSIFHLLGVAFVFTGINWKKRTWHKRLIVALTYLGICVGMAILADIILKGFFPVFFVKGQGPTALRQMVVVTAAILFGISGLLLMVLYLFSSTRMFYWYSLALLFICTGLICYTFAKYPGDPIAWLARSSTFLSGVYLLVAVVVGARELLERGDGLETGIVNLFRHRLESLVQERTLELSHAKEELQAAHNNLERANAELDKQLERLRLAKTAAKLGIFDYDLLSGTIDWDERVRELWGVGPDPPITYEIFESGLHPDDRMQVAAVQKEALDTRGSGRLEIEYRVINRKDDSEHWIFATGEVLFEEDRAIRLIGTVEDITKRKQIENEIQALNRDLERRVQERTSELEKAHEAIAAERRRLFEILETMPAMVCLLTPDYHVAFANRSFRERFGDDNGRHCHDYCFGNKERCEFCESFEVLKTGKPHHWEVKGPDGSVIDAYDFPFIDSDGSRLILEMDIDITEQRRAENALRESETKYKSLYDWSADGIFLTDYTGTILEVNQAAIDMYGYSLDEIRGTKVRDLIHPDDLKAIPFKLQDIVDGKLHFMMRRMRKKDGTYVTVEATAATVNDNLIQVIYRDVTERQELNELLQSRAIELATLNEELIRSNADLQQFAYVASHDLQEPLRNVASCLQMLEKGYKNKLDADADRYINYAVESSIRMKDLILGLLAYSRVATKGKPPQQVDSEKIFEQSLTNLSVAITESGAVVAHDELPTISADDTQLLQVFQNLIGNAIKFRRDDTPKIHVSAAKNKNEWIFSVRDNGIGIESRHLDRIFVIFQRLHKRSEYDGTGIGLAIVKKIVERHGGRIWVESEPGEGATFYFTMPERGIQA